MRRDLIVLFAAAALTAPASAAPDRSAYAAYASGDYARAVNRATIAGTAEDFALAARALNAVSYFDDSRKTARQTAKDAHDLAEKAIALDPELPEAHLQAAIALALKGARISPVRALFSGIAGDAREEIDAALRLAPDSAWALSTSAAWRMEVARRGGRRLYGADPEIGYREFMEARELAPHNIPIAYECALRLLASGNEEWRADALDALGAALAATPQTAFERDMQRKARELAAAVEMGPEAESAFMEKQP